MAILHQNLLIRSKYPVPVFRISLQEEIKLLWISLSRLKQISRDTVGLVNRRTGDMTKQAVQEPEEIDNSAEEINIPEEEEEPSSPLDLFTLAPDFSFNN